MSDETFTRAIQYLSESSTKKARALVRLYCGTVTGISSKPNNRLRHRRDRQSKRWNVDGGAHLKSDMLKTYRVPSRQKAGI